MKGRKINDFGQQKKFPSHIPLSRNSNPKAMIMTDNLLDLSVKEIMTKQVHTVNASESMMDVRKKMSNHHIRHAPVVKNGHMIGIISLTDVQRMTFASTYGEQEAETDDVISDMFNAETIMHKDPVTIDQKDTIRSASEILANSEFHALPVVNDGELVGIITTTDILKYILR